jgi:hypothetical protein
MADLNLFWNPAFDFEVEDPSAGLVVPRGVQSNGNFDPLNWNCSGAGLFRGDIEYEARDALSMVDFGAPVESSVEPPAETGATLVGLGRENRALAKSSDPIEGKARVLRSQPRSAGTKRTCN